MEIKNRTIFNRSGENEQASFFNWKKRFYLTLISPPQKEDVIKEAVMRYKSFNNKYKALEQLWSFLIPVVFGRYDRVYLKASWKELYGLVSEVLVKAGEEDEGIKGSVVEQGLCYFTIEKENPLDKHSEVVLVLREDKKQLEPAINEYKSLS